MRLKWILGLALVSLSLPIQAWDGQYQVVQQQPIQKFPKWTGILAEVQDELAKKADINAPYSGGWDEFVQKKIGRAHV